MKKVKKTLSLLLAALWLSLIWSPAALAEGDTNVYTVVLEYDDNVQLLYMHHGSNVDEWWTTRGDVPLGGAKLNGELVIPQLYCVDAQVPFHSYVGNVGGATTSPGGRTTDTVPGYVAVSPNELPAVLHGHWNELSWLVMNGYSDDASLAALNTKYSDFLGDNIGSLPNITKDVAVMATKAAVWHYTNPDVAFLSTNFLDKSNGDPNSANGVKHRQFVALMKRLVADADEYAANPSVPLYEAPLEIEIDPSLDPPDETTDLDATFYGPYYVRSTNVGTIEKVFLDISGPTGSGSIDFYKFSALTYTAILKDLQKYGEDSTSIGAGVDIGEAFYIRVPNDVSLDNVSITAFTRATVSDVAMPVVLVHQNADGSQDWEAIQAFIGLTTGNATVYASATLPLNLTNEGTIEVRKVSGNGVEAGPFYFRLTDSHGTPVRLDGTDIDASYIVNGAAGLFTLDDRGSASIGQLPFGDYIVTELLSGDGSTASYQIHSGAGVEERYSRVTQTIPLYDKNDNSPKVYTYTNHAAAPSITLKKQGGANGAQKLANAVFRLTKDDVYDSGDIRTDVNGEITFPALPVAPDTAGTYTLTEVAAPANHNALYGLVSIEVAADGTVSGFTVADARDGSRVSDEDTTGTPAFVITVVDVYNPDTPGGDEPGVPDTPKTPKTPDTPEIPETPEVPEIPDTPTEKPDEPDTPDTPDGNNPEDPDTPAPDTPEISDEPEIPGHYQGETDKPNRDVPQTGGDGMALWIALLCGSAGGVAGAFFWRAKWRREGKW
ncbi:MAG: Cys-Gln thioester bond-forming surface protein [Syntrophomonadaceae bacterium]|jgi:hypothetical protein|nr:Cys-Gln thioester bond-forming surface protein [Syntrophomonadaceae bacterium]